MKRIIRRILKILGIPDIYPLVNKIWFEDGEIYIHTNCRSGMFYLPIKKGEEYIYFLADIERTDKLPKGETIYTLTDIKDKSPKQLEEQK